MSLARVQEQLGLAPSSSPESDEVSPPQQPDTEGGLQLVRARTDRRVFLRVGGVALLVAALVALGVWFQFQTTHIVSRNALVRSHLSDLGVRIDGVVSDILVSAGQTVQQGDLLARMNDSHLQAQRVQAEAAVAALDERISAERAALAFARQNASVTLTQMQARYRRMQAEEEAARVRAEDAAEVYASRKALGSGGAVSGEELRDSAARAARLQSLARAAAAATLEAASGVESARLAEKSLTLREAELRVLSASRREAAAKLSGVEADIAGTRILAPGDGAILRRLAQPGMAVGPGTPVLSFWLTDDSWIEAWIPEESLGHVEVGSAVQVTFPVLPGERFAGRVSRIGLATDFEMPLDYLPQTREARMRPTPQVGVMVRLDSPPVFMRPGMSAIVDIIRGDG